MIKGKTLTENSVLVKIADAVALGGAAIQTDAFDTQGATSVVVFGYMPNVTGNTVTVDVLVGTESAENPWKVFETYDSAELVKAQPADPNAGLVMASPDQDGKPWALELFNPIVYTEGEKVFFRANVDRSGTDTAHGEVYALLLDLPRRPVPLEKQRETANVQLHSSVRPRNV